MINMKIAVTPKQPLEDIVKELDKRGYQCGISVKDDIRFVVTYDHGIYRKLKVIVAGKFKKTTLAELKEMK